MAVSWTSLLRVSLLFILLAAIATAFATLPIEKILKDFLVWIKQSVGPWGPLVLALAYIPLTILAVPASVLTLGGGYLFGLPLGFLADSIGATIGATAAFFLGRTIGRSYVTSKLQDYPKFQAVAIAIQRSGFKLKKGIQSLNVSTEVSPQNVVLLLGALFTKISGPRGLIGQPAEIVLLLRLVPLLPFNMLNYLLSVTPVGLGEYILASWIGMMPITFALVYVGTTLKDLSDVTHGWSEISTARWVVIIGGFVISVLLMICVTKVAKSSLDKALAENSEVENILVTPSSMTVPDSSSDIHQPLIIRIDRSTDNHKN